MVNFFINYFCFRYLFIVIFNKLVDIGLVKNLLYLFFMVVILFFLYVYVFIVMIGMLVDIFWMVLVVFRLLMLGIFIFIKIKLGLYCL